MQNRSDPATPSAGTLYVVATPIGNLQDWSQRAVETLQSCQTVLAEDTRTTRRLLDHWGIAKPRLKPLHEHNEQAAVAGVLAALAAGENLALVSDAGTPLVSDPGFPLVRAARLAGCAVIPIPGACAAIAALSASGLPTDRFWFEGFLPSRAAARRARLGELEPLPATLIFYEAPHRVEETVMDLCSVLGPEREGCVARELTKCFETTVLGTLPVLLEYLQASPDHRRGEFVLLVAGATDQTDRRLVQAEHVLTRLLPHVSPRLAAELATELTGAAGNAVYRLALRLAADRE